MEDGSNFLRSSLEEIVAREIPYVDREGRITEVRLLWGVNEWSAQNWTQAKLEGLNLQTIPTLAGHDREGEGIADDAMYELIQTVPLPRRYVDLYRRALGANRGLQLWEVRHIKDKRKKARSPPHRLAGQANTGQQWGSELL
ncbi:MAG TPA: hypothetical protein VGX03_06525, partial [Candidatus Binatia bacterium]|nr:hypothetical protein [Candidatus Binatia bacterium]